MGNYVFIFKNTIESCSYFIIDLYNIGIFIYSNQQPVLWQQPEMAFERYYWSSDLSLQSQDLLHTGFHSDDWKKLFSVFRVDA